MLLTGPRAYTDVAQFVYNEINSIRVACWAGFGAHCNDSCAKRDKVLQHEYCTHFT